MNDYSAPTSAWIADPPDTSGWKIEMYTCIGPLGRATSTVQASREGHTISAMASSPSVAMAMIKDEIAHRIKG